MLLEKLVDANAILSHFSCYDLTNPSSFQNVKTEVTKKTKVTTKVEKAVVVQPKNVVPIKPAPEVQVSFMPMALAIKRQITDGCGLFKLIGISTVPGSA